MTVDTIRQRINKTKSREEWQAEINHLSEYFAHLCVSVIFDLPEDWEGITILKTSEPFALTENGKQIHCQGMWREDESRYSVCLASEEKTPPTLRLIQIKNMASYQTIVKTLLKSIDKVEEYEKFMFGEW